MELLQQAETFEISAVSWNDNIIKLRSLSNEASYNCMPSCFIESALAEKNITELLLDKNLSNEKPHIYQFVSVKS